VSQPLRAHQGSIDDVEHPAGLVDDLDLLDLLDLRVWPVLRVHPCDGTVPYVAIGVYPGTFDPLTVAHLAVADAAVAHLDLVRLDLAISVEALGKEHLDATSVERRVDEVLSAIGDRPRLAVVVVEARLIADVAEGYDAVVMGADKWAQVVDPSWYHDDPLARDRAVARLPRVAVAPRIGHVVPAGLLLPVPERFGHISATEVRAGRTEWAAGRVHERSRDVSP